MESNKNIEKEDEIGKVIELEVIKRPRGRPRKYATTEEKMAAKRKYDIEYIKNRYKSDGEFREKAILRSKIYNHNKNKLF